MVTELLVIMVLLIAIAGFYHMPFIVRLNLGKANSVIRA